MQYNKNTKAGTKKHSSLGKFIVFCLEIDFFEHFIGFEFYYS